MLLIKIMGYENIVSDLGNSLFFEAPNSENMPFLA
jgi:hypothetical protein